MWADNTISVWSWLKRPSRRYRHVSKLEILIFNTKRVEEQKLIGESLYDNSTIFPYDDSENIKWVNFLNTLKIWLLM